MTTANPVTSQSVASWAIPPNWGINMYLAILTAISPFEESPRKVSSAAVFPRVLSVFVVPELPLP